MHALKTEAARYRSFRERLLAKHPELDEDTLSDTLEGLSDLNEMIAAAARSALEDEARAEALKQRIQAMKSRLERIKARARATRHECALIMAEVGARNLLTDDLTISVREGRPAVQIIDAQQIPSPYWRTPDPVLDKSLIGDALRSGASVPGAVLAIQEPALAVRVK